MTTLLVRNLIDLGSSLVVLSLAILALHSIERVTARFVSHRLGWNAVLLTGWIGVPLHEISHLAVALLFGHRIVAWKLFEPDPSTGTLGYVWHAYRRRNLWQLSGNFFVGIAPLIAGGLALLLFVTWMAPDVSAVSLSPARAATIPMGSTAWLGSATWVSYAGHLLKAMLAWVAAIWRARTIWLPLQIYFCIAIASHLAPSPRDLASAVPALPVVLALSSLLAWVLSIAGHASASAPLIIPAAGLLVIMVVLFQGLYVAAIGVIGTLRPHRPTRP